MLLSEIRLDQGALSGKVSDKGFQDVSLLTGDMDTGGHGVYLDEKTVETCTAALLGRSLPSYLTHKGADKDRLGKEIAVVSGIYRDGMKVRAKQLNFLDAFSRNDTATRDTLVELAKTAPDQLGVSLVLSFSKVWVGHDGKETDGSEPKPENAIRAVPSMRVRGVKSADLVQRPAANLGLFEKKDPKIDELSKEVTMPTNTIALEAHEAALSAHKAELATKDSTYKAALEQLASDHSAALAEKDKAHKAALEAKVAELTTAHTAALAEKDKAIADAQVFDMRRVGVEPAIKFIAKQVELAQLPEPASTDQARWDQHAELEKKDKKLAAQFYEKHLARK